MPVPSIVRGPWPVAAAIAVLAVLTFLPSLGNDFVSLDDALYVYSNSLVRGGLAPEGIARAFSGPECNFYHPLTMLSLMLDHQLWGLEPAGFRLTNILVHAATAALLFSLLDGMTRARWRSALVAAVFAVHPLRVESVAWVAERKDVLSAFFFILTLLLYVWYARRPFHAGRYLVLLAAFIVGLLCKTTLATIPGVMVLLDFWPLRRSFSRRLILEKLPFVAIAVVACLVAMVAQKAGVAPYADFPLGSRISNAVVSYVTYIGQTFAPLGLSPFYPFSTAALAPWRVAACLLLLVGVTTGALVLHRRAPYLAVGWFWYLGVLVPMIGIVQVGAFAHADRFTYLPQIGLLVMLAWGAHDLAGNRPSRRAILGLASAAILFASVAISIRQIGYWKDSETLYRRALAVTTENGLAHGNLGVALLEHREKGVVVPREVPAGRRDEAIAHFREAVRLLPDHADTHLNLGLQLARTASKDEAIEHLRIALRTMTFHAGGHHTLGLLLLEKNQPGEAAVHFEKAIALKPANVSARNNLASIYRREGRLDEAIAQYHAALSHDPDFADAHNNLGIVLFQTGRKAEAIHEFQEALRCDPGNANFLKNLEMARQ